MSNHCTCSSCGQTTAVHALAVPPSHETLDPDDSDDEQTESLGQTDGDFQAWLLREDGWHRDPSGAVLSGVSLLDRPTLDCITPYTPGFAPDPKRRGVWTNHCSHCKQPILTGQLMAFPGSAFTPSDADQARAVGIQRMTSPLQASVELRWTDAYPDLWPLLQHLGFADHNPP
ncbi:hypothetical protein [Bordetella holmesii]|uniref:hypothetical protein n=1 Tax=Bordetella holmesii TaxID=35814 RepID=UPI001F1BC110|nr:hypothetical protein [Bordetella holmesii]